jgi:hypothetical protein
MLSEGFTTGADVLAKARMAFKVESIEVPEWGLTVQVRELTAGQRDKFEGEQVSATGPEKFKNFRARLVVLTACVPGGRLLFTEDQVNDVASLPASGVDKVFDAACRLNRLLKEDVESLEKN